MRNPVTTLERLTPRGRGAVAVITANGTDAGAQIESFFFSSSNRRLSQCPLGRILHGRWGSDHGEEVVICRRTETIVEVHCHGGDAASDRIIGDLTGIGCKVSDSTTQSPYGQTDGYIRAEARRMLATAPTERTAAILLDQFNGALKAALNEVIANLNSGQIDQAAARLDRLLERSALGLHLTTPWRIVLAGPPNVGKSSLLNALLGFRRSIVFDEPGTTRDVVAAMTALDGWPIELSDTAGLRATDDTLEQTGVDRARRQLASADGVLLVFDLTAPWTAECTALVEAYPESIVVHNKLDLEQSAAGRPDGLRLSAKTGQGIETLAARIAARLVPRPPEFNDPVPFTHRMVDQLRAAEQALGDGIIVDVNRLIASLPR